jgi:hypothetical protein
VATVKLYKYIELLPDNERARIRLNSTQFAALEEGLHAFLDSTPSRIESGAGGAKLLAGQFQIEVSDLVLDTLGTAAELIFESPDANSYLKSLPSIALWFGALYKDITVIKKKKGDLCVFRAFLSAEILSPGLPITAEGIFAALSCKNGKQPIKECRFASKQRCSISLAEARTALSSLARQQLVSSTGNDTWVILKK